MITKVKVKSPANIAFIKYWGQKSKELVLPYHDSFSMNLSDCYSIVELEITDDPKQNEMYVKKYKAKKHEKSSKEAIEKVAKFFSMVKDYLGVKEGKGFIIQSENSFPQKAGIASSASFYSALTLAIVEVFDKNISEAELSALARLSGSGSACRSIPTGFTWWHKGVGENTTELLKSSYAESIADVDYWDLVDVVLILNPDEKKTGSQEGHTGAAGSTFFADRLLGLDNRVQEIREAFDQKDFKRFGKLIEEDTLSMHMVMMTQQPPLYFWSGKTLEIMKKTVELREWGVEAYYTIDAGENVHVICQKKDEEKIITYFKKQPEVQEMIVNYPAAGAHVLEIA